MAKKTLKENLKQEYQVTLTVDGSTKYMAGMIIELDESWGKFEGKYVIDKVKHSITGDYSCELECMKVGAKENAEKNKRKKKRKKKEKKLLKILVKRIRTVKILRQVINQVIKIIQLIEK